MERVEETWTLLVAAWKVKKEKFVSFVYFEGKFISFVYFDVNFISFVVDFSNFYLLHEPDSIKTGTNGRVAADVCGCKG